MISSSSCVSPTLDALVSRCQVLAGRFPDAAPADLLDDIAQTAVDMPLDELAVTERMMAGMVLVRMVSHWAERSRLATPVRFADRLVDLATLPVTTSVWQDRWINLLDLCRHALNSRVEPPVPPRTCSPRAALLVTAIAARYRDSSLRLRDVACAANVSSWHAAHLLSRETGQGFVAHVRDHRVTAARQLLDHTLLSVKEIAARVGYSSARQLTRDFKRRYAVTPYACRVRGRS
jgi:AraC-like DNA-binding protein